MKVVHLSKNDTQGGAARAAFRLHKGLQLQGHDSSMLVVNKSSDDPNVREYSKPMDIANIVVRGVRQLSIEHAVSKYTKSRPPGLGLFNGDRSSYATTLLPQIPASDVINLHWVPGFVDYE